MSIDSYTLKRQREDLRKRNEAPRPKRDELRSTLVPAQLPFTLPLGKKEDHGKQAP